MSNEAIQSFITDNLARFSPETVRSYKSSLTQFFSFCKKDLNDVKAADVRAWLASLEEQGLKPRTIHVKLSALKSFYQYSMEENLTKKNPTLTVHTPKKDDSLPYYLSKREVALFQELTRNDLRDRALVEALYTTGVRISELLNIKLEDIKLETRQIWIRKGKGNKERFVLFTHDCAERLKAYLESRKVNSEFLFSNSRGGRWNRTLIEIRFQEFSETLGFKVTPHTMRHTFAAHLAEKNMSQSYIQELLGLVNINTTSIYTRLMNTPEKNNMSDIRDK
ncbi:integrase/recombinase XerC/integrase/recombinase XerD [Bacillus sp. OV322]|uniref:site-specific tyrosine recombinase/integron integrase n=1 Tax=Bacillus sp. OV322 TaxID=1882764 RepID=UPI0008E36438|nr:site-specific tyrosine recombinase/integron integrase [Bacillus sp. OV322]SFC22988.1 integrase/recombinase XerC/integrase/recombinase XerD [Bacillus sp. OV322]